MTIQIPPGYAQFTVEHWLANFTRPACTVWGVDVSANQYTPDSMAQGFLEIYADAFKAGFDSNVTLRDCRMVLGQDAVDPIIGNSSTTIAGTAVRESTAPALACLLDLRTNVGGRRNRGRKFLPWALSDTSVSEMGSVEASAVTGWNSRSTSLISELATNQWSLVILHGTGVTTPPAPTAVTSMTCNPVVSTQRRRQARF